MRHVLLYLALASLTTASTGCEEPITCTTEAVTSVTLTVVDADTGERIPATVTYLVQSEGPRDAEEAGDPGKYWLGVEEDGTFEVTVSADGYASVTTEYEVTSDECHVEPVSDMIELQPAP